MSEASDQERPPIFTPDNELCALLFAAIPCVSEEYRSLFSILFYLSELSKKHWHSAKLPPFSMQDKGIGFLTALFPNPELLVRSLNYYSFAFQMPGLATIANLLQAFTLYHTWKDFFPNGLNTGAPASFAANDFSFDDFFSSGFSPEMNASKDHSKNTIDASVPTNEDAPTASPISSENNTEAGLFQSLYSMLTPEQLALYEQLMNTESTTNE